MQPANDSIYNFFGGLYTRYSCHSEMKIAPTYEETPERTGDGIRFKSCRCHLVQQGLKAVVIVPVKHHHLVMPGVDALCKTYAPEATAEDDDPLFGGIGHIQAEMTKGGGAHLRGFCVQYVAFYYMATPGSQKGEPIFKNKILYGHITKRITKILHY